MFSAQIADILMQYSRGKSALVFCSTRKGAQEAAQRLSQTVMTYGYSNPFIKSREQQERLREASLSCSDKQIQSYILYGGCFPAKLYFSEMPPWLRIMTVHFFFFYFPLSWLSQWWAFTEGSQPC